MGWHRRHDFKNDLAVISKWLIKARLRVIDGMGYSLWGLMDLRVISGRICRVSGNKMARMRCCVMHMSLEG